MRKKKNKKNNLNTLEDVLVEIWKMLDRGATHYNDSFHWPVLGTASQDGCSQRSVILRGFRPAERILVCHTDSRARKAGQIREDSRVSWLFYHPRKKVQLRINGQAELHTDDSFADEQWEATRVTNRLNYSTEDPPGASVSAPTTGLPDLLLNKIPSLLETEKARKNFMSISCHFNAIDWLLLSPLGNRRARFDWKDDEMTASWIVP